MSFLFIILLGTGLAGLIGRVAPYPHRLRDCMRVGVGAAFLFTGTDHFVSAETRYVPMMPEALADHALFWVYLTGVAEHAGGLALVLPKKIGAMNLSPHQRVAGMALALLMICVLPANITVALRGSMVAGLDFGAWYYWIRPMFQPVFIMWVLYSTNVVFPSAREGD